MNTDKFTSYFTLPYPLSSPKGYFLKYTPNPGFSGLAAERIAIVIADTGNLVPFEFSLIYLYIDILPVNDAPTLFYKVNGNILQTDAPMLPVPLSIPAGAEVVLADHITDVDADINLPTFILSVTLNSGGGSVKAVVAGTTVNANAYVVQGTLNEINGILASIQYSSNSATTAVVTISVNDRGSSGVCPTGLENLKKPDGTCPRETKVRFMINVTSHSVSLISSIAASSGIGVAFILGAALSIYASKKLKEKSKESWKEFDEENFEDFSRTNPIFQNSMERGMSSRGSNPLYQSSIDDSDQQF